MIRKDREITEIEKVRAILDACKVMRVGMCDYSKPYVIPINYGYAYENNNFEFYFHCAHKGRKAEILAKNSNVCVEIDLEGGLLEGEHGCEYSYYYQSFIGFGVAELVSETQTKIELLNNLMLCQTGKTFEFTEAQMKGVAIYKIALNDWSAKGKCK